MKRNVFTGVVLGVVALSIVAGAAAPAFADTDDTTAWHQVQVTSSAELVFTGSQSDNVTLAPTATGGEDHAAGGVIGVRANQAWKVQWQAVQGAYTIESTTAAAGTFLTATGFGATAANASLSYQGTNAVANGTNVWSAQLASTGTNQTLAFSALTTALGNIWTGITVNASMTPTYSADIDSTLTSGTYYGTIYYKLSSN